MIKPVSRFRRIRSRSSGMLKTLDIGLGGEPGGGLVENALETLGSGRGRALHGGLEG